MMVLAAAVCLALLSIAALHIAWGFGITFPATDEKTLIGLAIGETGRTATPTPLQCFAAAAAIAGSGILALLLIAIDWPPAPATVITSIGVIASVVFAVRGLAAYLPAWRRRFAMEPFADLDRRYYGPFCCLVAIALSVLTIQRFGAVA